MVVLDELQLLKPLDPAIRDDSDAWPEFVLRRVKVVSQDTKEAVQLLSARHGHLVTVTGHLGKLDSDTAHLAKSAKPASDLICIRNVASYSFSQYIDGSFGFWAAGKAGWYEIRSAADSYAPVLRNMEEATSMFYFLADRLLADGRIRAPEQYVRSLMQDYVKADYSRRRDPVDAKEGFYEHRDFLMRSMLEGQEVRDWSASAILRHFKKHFPSDFAAAQKTVKDNGKPAPEPVQDDMDVDPSPKEAEPETPANTAALRQTNDSAQMDIDDEDAEEEPPRQYGLRGALRLRSAQSSKRYTAQEDTSQKSTSESESGADETDEMIQDDQIPSANGAASVNGREHVDASVAGFWPQPSYYEPRGAGDTWTCSFDGCNHKIWDARTAKSRGLIEDHFSKKHADDLQSLIMSESNSQAPVKHLLSRLRNVRTIDPEAARMLANMELPERVARKY